MKIVLFTKMLNTLQADELAELGRNLRLDGYDLCVREGQPVTPQNVEQELPRFARRLEEAGTPIRMVSGPAFPLDPQDSDSRRIVAALAEANIPYYKLGYPRLNTLSGTYAQKIRHTRNMLQQWQKIAETHNIQMCCHTYGGGGTFGYFAFHNAAALNHIMEDTDPRYIRAYVDPGLLLLFGEPHPLAFEILRDRVSLIGLQEVLLSCQADGDEGKIKPRWVPAGQGSVPWSGVFQTLHEMQFDGLLVVHAEFESPDPHAYRQDLEREIAYFRQKRQAP